MDAITATAVNQLGQEMTRRRLIRKAAYTAPAVFTIAAALPVAVGASGHTTGKGKAKGNDRD